MDKAVNESYRRLWAAVLLQAIVEAQDADPGLAAPARRWLAGEGAKRAEMLDIAPEQVARWVDDLPALPYEQLTFDF